MVCHYGATIHPVKKGLFQGEFCTDNFLHAKQRVTKMSDMTQLFEVIMTSFSSDKRNGQVQV